MRQQSRTRRNRAALVDEMFGSVEEERKRSRAALVAEDAAFRESLELARLVQEIVNHGESERECRPPAAHSRANAGLAVPSQPEERDHDDAGRGALLRRSAIREEQSFGSWI